MERPKRQRIGGLNELNRNYWRKIEMKHGRLTQVRSQFKVAKSRLPRTISCFDDHFKWIKKRRKEVVDDLLKDDVSMCILFQLTHAFLSLLDLVGDLRAFSSLVSMANGFKPWLPLKEYVKIVKAKFKPVVKEKEIQACLDFVFEFLKLDQATVDARWREGFQARLKECESLPVPIFTVDLELPQRRKEPDGTLKGQIHFDDHDLSLLNDSPGCKWILFCLMKLLDRVARTPNHDSTYVFQLPIYEDGDEIRDLLSYLVRCARLLKFGLKFRQRQFSRRLKNTMEIYTETNVLPKLVTLYEKRRQFLEDCSSSLSFCRECLTRIDDKIAGALKVLIVEFDLTDLNKECKPETEDWLLKQLQQFNVGCSSSATSGPEAQGGSESRFSD